MSVWRTEELLRLGLRACSLRSLWHQHSILTTPVMDKASLVHHAASRLTQTGSAVTPVRFYSQERIQNLSTEVQPDDPTSQPEKRISPFSILIQKCDSPSDVLDLTCQYAPTTNQVSKCIIHMWLCAKKMTEDQRRYELQLMFQHNALDQLLQSAMKNVDQMRDKDFAFTLLSLVKLGIPQRSRVMQTFLRSCQEKVNTFDEKALSIVSSVLHQMESGPNVSALKDGIRLVAEGRLSKIQDVIALQSMMRLVGKSATPEFKRNLEAKALSMQDQFSVPNSHHMLSTMAVMDLRSKPLTEFCSNKIRENLHTIPFTRLFKVLQSYWELQYRDKDLFTDFSDYFASVINIWTNKQIVLFLFMFEKLGFCPEAFMEAFAEKVIADPDALTLKDLLCILKVYSSLNYDLKHRRQQFLDGLSRVIESYLPKMSKIEVLRAVYALCLLNHFPAAPLELLLQENTLEHLKSTPSKFLVTQDRLFRTVDLCLRLDRPPLPQPLTVPSSALGDSTFTHSAVSSLLSQCLQEVLEERGDAEVQKGVLVENFYFIDAVITKSSATEGGEDSPAESSHKVALLSVPYAHLCFGTSRPHGPLAAKIRHLRILGFEPVMLQEHELHSLLPEKRTEFLRELIFPEHRHSDKTEKEQLEDLLD